MCVNCSFSPKREFVYPDEIKFELDKFLSVFRTSQFRDALIEHSSLDQKSVEYSLRVTLSEVYVGLDLIWEDLIRLKPDSILEVGAGSKLVSYFLTKKGYNVTALEPFQEGFGFYRSIEKLIDEHFSSVDIPTIPLYAEDLNPEIHGKFSYMFSVNVLEHIHKLEEAILAMKSVLEDGGAMRHTCPNYNIPYEVHFGIPLIPFKPGLTKYFYEDLVATRPGVWDSLNFVTYSRTKRALSQNKLKSTFTKGLTYEAFKRLGGDSVFKERHGSTIAGKIYKFLNYTRLLSLMKFIPTSHTTPMEFIAYK